MLEREGTKSFELVLMWGAYILAILRSERKKFQPV